MNYKLYALQTRFCIKGLQEDGLPVPEPVTLGEYFQIEE
jgi:hypothetical protein